MKDIEFKTIEKENSAEIVEKKSRFIANIYNVESKEEAEEKIKQIKKKYYDAKHHCFAFSIIEENGIIFANPGSISLPRGNSYDCCTFGVCYIR